MGNPKPGRRAGGRPVRPPFGRGDRDGLRDHTRNRDLCLRRGGGHKKEGGPGEGKQQKSHVLTWHLPPLISENATSHLILLTPARAAWATKRTDVNSFVLPRHPGSDLASISVSGLLSKRERPPTNFK